MSLALVLGSAITFATSNHPVWANAFLVSGVVLMLGRVYFSKEVIRQTRRKRLKLRVLIVVGGLLLAGLGVWGNHQLSKPRAPTNTENNVAEILKWIQNKDAQERWLAQYPLGYTIFDVNAVTGAVTPYEARKGLEDVEFDYRPVQIIENTSQNIRIALPTVNKNGKPYLTSTEIGGDKTTMQMYGAGFAFTHGDDMIWGMAQVLRYEGERVYWLFGLRKTKAPST